MPSIMTVEISNAPADLDAQITSALATRREDIPPRAKIAVEIGEMISASREATHGNPHEQFTTAQELKETLQKILDGRRAPHLSPTQEEALHMICSKLARIVHGAQHKDHWMDIAGYAIIAAEGVDLI